MTEAVSSQNLPPEYEGKFKMNEWNAMQLKGFTTGPKGYHWAQLANNNCEFLPPNSQLPCLNSSRVSHVL